MQSNKSKAAESILTTAAVRLVRPNGAHAPIERMAVILQALKNGRKANCSILAEQIETSPRTIARDLEFMRDRLVLPIEWQSDQNSYVYLGGAL